MKHEDGRAMGICLDASGAVIALVRSQPTRLVAIANVSWPEGFWQHPGQQLRACTAARRMLARARRQLAVPRSTSASIVIGHSLSGYPAETLLPASADLLASAGLCQTHAVAANWAATLRHEVMVAPGELAAAAANDRASLAIGAAMAGLAPSSFAVAIPAPQAAPTPPPPAPIALTEAAPGEEVPVGSGPVAAELEVPVVTVPGSPGVADGWRHGGGFAGGPPVSTGEVRYVAWAPQRIDDAEEERDAR